MTTEPRYHKIEQGKRIRYEKVEEHFYDLDNLPIGAHLIVVHPEGGKSYRLKIDPDKAAVLAAIKQCQHAMEEAMTERYVLKPALGRRPIKAMLKTKTLFEEIDLVGIAVDRLKAFEPAEGYYGAFSGGKDSCVIKELARLAGVKVDWHYNWTTVDPPELLQFIKKHHADVEIHKPEMTMWQLIVKKRYPPTRMVRYCCEILKEGGGSGRRVITGVRWAESSKRAKRKSVERCFKDSSKTYVNPIIEWSDSDVWEFIREQQLSYCSLYDEGFTRLGCIMCPMGGKNMIREAERWPRIAQAYRRACHKALQKRIADGLTTKWEHGDEMFNWWMRGGVASKADPDQTVMFE